MYKINGVYYIWITRPGDEQRVLKSTGGPFGPYECRQVLKKMLSPVAGSAAPHQGALVDTIDGRWFYMAFIDAYPGGRLPVLAPIKFDEDGWPSIVCDRIDLRGSWRLSYDVPLPGCKRVQNPVGPYRDTFSDVSKLNPRWEWNHNPDNTRWGISSDGLTLQTACVTSGLYSAVNTLTHRVLGPKSQATFHLDISGMADGDRAGVSLFRDESAYIGVHRDHGVTTVVYVDGIALDGEWKVASDGGIQDQGPQIQQEQLWLRVKADITPAFYGEARHDTRFGIFEYSLDGVSFDTLGDPFALKNSWEWYLGYRFALFNFAMLQLGGRIVAKCFELKKHD